MKMDDGFRILFDYVEQMERELAEKDKADLQTKSAEDEEKKCVHESIETEEAYLLMFFISYFVLSCIFVPLPFPSRMHLSFVLPFTLS